MKKYFKIFKNEIYKPIDLTYIKSKLPQINIMFNDTIDKLKKLKYFKLFSKYFVYPVFYSSGESYRFSNNIGIIYLKVNNKGKFNKSTTIIHEIVHMGIENTIVKKYNLSHSEKEHVVDMICSEYLKLHKYKIQKGYISNNLSSILTYDNIPTIIKKK
jgi:hypothetical protein